MSNPESNVRKIKKWRRRMKRRALNLIAAVILLGVPLSASAADDALLEILRANGVITPAQYESLKKVYTVPLSANQAASSAADEELLKILLANGAISQAQYATLRHKTTQETSTTAHVASAPPPIGSEQDLATVPGGIENLRKNDYRDVFTSLENVATHTERFSMGLTALKAQYIYDSTKINLGTSPGTIDPAPLAAVPRRDKNGFRIRAAEFYATGRLTEWSNYYVEFDFARQNEIALNSMYMDFYLKDMLPLKSLFPYVSKLRVGQFREPFGIEQGTSQGL